MAWLWLRSKDGRRNCPIFQTRSRGPPSGGKKKKKNATIEATPGGASWAFSTIEHHHVPTNLIGFSPRVGMTLSLVLSIPPDSLALFPR